MNKMYDNCLITHCSYEPFSESCQSASKFNTNELQETIADKFNTNELQETIADKLAVNQQREIGSNILAKQFISD